MVSRNVIIMNPTGLHARPASDFIAEASKYSAKITINRIDGDEDDEANAKSIIQVLALGLSQGEEALICAAGEDAQMAVDGLSALIESGFGEL